MKAMLVRFAAAYLVAAACTGCRPGAPDTAITTGGPTGSKLWTGTGDGPGVPGLDGGGHCHCVGKLLLVWAADATGGGGGSTGGPHGISGESRVTFRGGRTATVTFHLPDERSGTAQFEGTEYQLANGRVFLLKLVGDKVVVKQVDKDLSGIDLPTADFAAAGRADPVIRTFFEAGK
jgi:hypothetical protein